MIFNYNIIIKNHIEYYFKMISFYKFVICIILLLTISNTSYSMNYENYIKNIYHIPSYDNLEYSFKNEFYENVYKHLNILNYSDNIPITIYKSKLDNIILYI